MDKQHGYAALYMQHVQAAQTSSVFEALCDNAKMSLIIIAIMI
jgi:hypothetical protein